MLIAVIIIFVTCAALILYFSRDKPATQANIFQAVKSEPEIPPPPVKKKEKKAETS